MPGTNGKADERRPWRRRRRYLVHGRYRVPFEGYERRRNATTDEPGEAAAYPIDFGPDCGLTPSRAWTAHNRWARRKGRLRGPWLAAQRAGIISAVKRGAVGNRHFGCSNRRRS